jgi:hypothetical protein
MATFGDVFGLAFGIEGFSFFMEAIFIAIYVYGWDRLSPRTHIAVGAPVIVAGFTGSLMVISVNGWMNQPTGFSIRNGEVVHVKPPAPGCAAGVTGATRSGSWWPSASPRSCPCRSCWSVTGPPARSPNASR